MQSGSFFVETLPWQPSGTPASLDSKISSFTQERRFFYIKLDQFLEEIFLTTLRILFCQRIIQVIFDLE